MNLTKKIIPSVKESEQTIDKIQLWTALITPMLPCGEVDYETLILLAQHQSDVGNGITLLGSTGEGLALTVEEQYNVVHCICALNLPVPIMVTVGGHNLATQLAWIKQCNQLPISAFLVSSPLYTKPGPLGLTQWFSALLEEANFPCMIYNVPSRSGVNIPLCVMKKIQHHENCWAMKEASGDLMILTSFVQHCPAIDVFSGEDAMLPFLGCMGIKGLVSVAANVWPQATKVYVENALAGKHENIFPVWKNAIDALFQVASPIPVKVLMAINKMIKHSTLRLPLTEQEVRSNEQIVIALTQANQAIMLWLKESQQRNIMQLSGEIN